jgi:molybdopterin-guanine dinucleotide biosynthesis protein A
MDENENLSAGITIAILAGGHSQRMGQHKALLPLPGKPDSTFLDYLQKQLASRGQQLLVAGEPEVDLYPDSLTGQWQLVHDRFADAGPLAGVHTALNASENPVVVTVPCDGLVLPEYFVQKMCQKLKDDNLDVVYATDAGSSHYLYGAWRTKQADALGLFLQGGGRRVKDWIQRQNFGTVDFSENDFTFLNVNTQADLKALDEVDDRDPVDDE